MQQFLVLIGVMNLVLQPHQLRHCAGRADRILTMKKTLMLLAIVASTTACSTKTLINLNVDADSFIPAATRTGSTPVTAGTVDYRFPDDDGDPLNGNDLNGALLSIPSVNFITAAKLSLKLTLETSATGSLEVYIAPGNTANLYQAQFRVLQAANTSGPSFAGQVNLAAASSDPAQAQAFSAIQSGSFRVGARLQGSAVTGTTVRYSVEDLTVGVSGYPIKVLF